MLLRVVNVQIPKYVFHNACKQLDMESNYNEQ